VADQRVRGGLGVMLDDLLAGAYALGGMLLLRAAGWL
jgi:phosphatidylglycerophosphatase A